MSSLNQFYFLVKKLFMELDFESGPLLFVFVGTLSVVLEFT